MGAREPEIAMEMRPANICTAKIVPSERLPVRYSPYSMQSVVNITWIMLVIRLQEAVKSRKKVR